MSIEKAKYLTEKLETIQHEFPNTVDPADAKLERQTVLKLDLLLVPVVCAIYLLSFLDRSNLGNARVAGLQEQLGLTDHQYQTVITVTYVPYIAAELPSNLVLKKIGPRIMLPGMCVCWGIVTTLQSQVHNFGGLVTCRFFLGLFEGGLLPGIVLYLSGFYRRHELQVRIGLFFSAAAMSGAFSGLLAAAIVRMDGVGGLEGWRWIFLLEGLFTVLFGVFSFFVLPNTPSQVLTFTPAHALHCEARLLLDTQTQVPESISPNLKAFLSTFKTLHIWIVVLCQFCGGTCLFGLAYFTPSIVASLASSFASQPSKAEIQLLTVPPFVFAFLFSMATAYVSDRFRLRGVTAIIMTLVAILGLVLFITAPLHNIAVRYTSLCLIITGIYSTAPSIISWIPNNVATHTRRATAVALSFIATNVGGILSAWIYPKSSAPQYKFAAKFNLSLECVAVVAMAGEVLLLRWLNQRKVDKREELLRDVSDLDEHEQYERLGDAHPDFKYTL